MSRLSTLSALTKHPALAWWHAMPETTRQLAIPLSVVAGLLVLAVLTLLPSLAVIRAAPSDHQKLDQQLELMRQLATQALSAKAQPKANPDEALKFLDTSVKQSLAASAQMAVSGDRATITLKNASPESLSAWLAQLRGVGRLLPAEAKLTRSDTGWSGQVVVNLPQP